MTSSLLAFSIGILIAQVPAQKFSTFDGFYDVTHAAFIALSSFGRPGLRDSMSSSIDEPA